jgi:VCBS repeat-containing protein
VANDGADDSNVATVTITVNAVNDAPVALDDVATTDEDVAVSIDVLANDDDVDSAFEVTAFSGAANGTVAQNPDGTFTYTPNADFNGTDSFTYTLSDGALEDTATVTITVNPVNDAPVAGDDAYSTDEDTALLVPAPGVRANDDDVDEDELTTTLVNGPASGELTLNPDGSFSYTPTRRTTSSTPSKTRRSTSRPRICWRTTSTWRPRRSRSTRLPSPRRARWSSWAGSTPTRPTPTSPAPTASPTRCAMRTGRPIRPR